MTGGAPEEGTRAGRNSAPTELECASLTSPCSASTAEHLGDEKDQDRASDATTEEKVENRVADGRENEGKSDQQSYLQDAQNVDPGRLGQSTGICLRVRPQRGP